MKSSGNYRDERCLKVGTYWNASVFCRQCGQKTDEES
jgi:hypothetical protein